MKLRSTLSTVYACLLLASGLSTRSALADAGRTPIFQPTVITQSGAYYVTRDFAAATGHAIDVQADQVEIDMAGHTITQTGAFAVINAVGRKSLAIHGPGRLKGGTHAVNFDNSAGGGALKVSELAIESSSIGIRAWGNCSCCYNQAIEIQGNRITSTTNGGILVESVDVLTIEGNQVSGSGSTSISTNCVDVERTVANLINASGPWGYTTGNNDSLTFKDNTLTTTSGSGASLAVNGSAVVENNTIYAGAVVGGTRGIVYYGAGGQIAQNSIRNYDIGLNLPTQADTNFIHHNAITGRRGVVIESNRNSIDANQLVCSAFGLVIGSTGTGNVYSYNRYNGLASISAGNTNGGGNF